MKEFQQLKKCKLNTSTYIEVTWHIQLKESKSKPYTINLQIQQESEAIHTIKLQVQQNLKWKLQIQQTTILTHCFVLITTSKCGIEYS